MLFGKCQMQVLFLGPVYYFEASQRMRTLELKMARHQWCVGAVCANNHRRLGRIHCFVVPDTTFAVFVLGRLFSNSGTIPIRGVPQRR